MASTLAVLRVNYSFISGKQEATREGGLLF
jgi:hypothetical protein